MPSTSLLDKRSLPPIASHHSISFDQETAKFKSIPQHIVPHVQMKSKVECTLIYCHKSFNICLSSSLFHTFFFSDFHYGSGRVLKRPDLLPMGNFFWKSSLASNLSPFCDQWPVFSVTSAVWWFNCGLWKSSLLSSICCHVLAVVLFPLMSFCRRKMQKFVPKKHIYRLGFVPTKRLHYLQLLQ